MKHRPCISWRSPDDYKHALMRRGFQRIGEGLFSEVFARPDHDIALRVSRGSAVASREIGAEADGWPHYVGWAAEAGFLGTFAPAVRAFKTLNTRDGGTFYVAAMERLDCTIAEACASGRHVWRNAARQPRPE